MAIGDRRRMTGLLTTAENGLVLKPESGGLIGLDSEPVHVRLIGQRVTIEGIESAWNRLSVETIECAVDRGGDTRER